MDEKKAYGKQGSGSFRKRPRDQFDNGKRKKHNPNYDHGSTNKPIDTIYRILCPVKKIGSVLGKGGDIVNALRDETHAKIRVADAIPGAEERVIIIFNYQSESEKSNPGQDTENSDTSELENTQPNCPAQDALLKIHDRIAADEILRGGVVQDRTEPDDIVTARILVPKNQVGCLLGKGGNIIQQLRTDTGANIRILPSDHLPRCAMGSDELVQVSGVPSITKKALFRISTLLHQHPNKENPPLETIIYASTQGSNRSDSSLPPPFLQGNRVWSPYYSDTRDQPTISRFGRYPDEPLRYPPGSFSRNNFHESEAAEEFSMRILCATVKIGGVIGKGGTNIRQLEQQTGARIQVEDTAPDAEERVINISCKEVPWETRSPTIEAVLQLQSRTSTNSDDGAITTRLLVPSSKVGSILGKGGDIITEMRRRTRADIRVYSKDDKPKYTSANEELVQISGPREFSRDALAEIASRLRARTFRSENSSFSPASAPAAPFRGVPPFERISHRGAPSAGNTDTGSTRPGHFRGYTPERFLDRGTSSSSMFGPEKSVGYDYPKAYRQSYEAQYYHSPSASGYTNKAPAESKIPYGGATSFGRADISNSEIHQVPGARVKSHDPMLGVPDHVIHGHGPSEYSRPGQGYFPPPYMPSGSQSIPPSQQSIHPC
ncbi:KH domain-containing protein HEN4-like isoform X1 [Zingiber officinale]|uniref:KH domain-containing protein HEN4-like isoform X1 n=1 Tax=Zingiber officinale TaxID=94328 RepID=UPI001C4A76A5|nr:KH domain-containing protein HEN4-like isoform X1 [Zingiber officinale]